MNTESFDMPIWICPACKKKQQQDDYYELESGCDLVCGFCEKEFKVAWVDTTMTVTIEVKP